MKFALMLLPLFMFFNINAHAFKFSPMTTSIDLSTKKNSTIFFLENDTTEPIAITAKVLKRKMNIEGEENNEEVQSEFSLYPPQLIIPPNEKRSVKVTWNNKYEISSEEAYRLVAEQMPISLEQNKKDKANIKVLLRYVAALYVTKNSFESDIKLKKIERKNNNLILLVENKGLKHQILANLKIIVTNGKTKTNLSLEELAGMGGENVLAQSERAFVFPDTGKFKSLLETSNVKFEFENN